MLFVGTLVLRSSASAAAWAAFAVAFVALWLIVGRELWLHYFELPRRYPRFAGTHPQYFTGTLWMLTPRFLWHLILLVVTVSSALHVFRSNALVEVQFDHAAGLVNARQRGFGGGQVGAVLRAFDAKQAARMATTSGGGW